MKWTDRQEKAITERDTNLLVSAAAGSGKTAVLVERITQLLIDGKESIGHFLVVTFTKAAASEMKDKLAASIRAEIRKNGPDTAFLKKQLADLQNADISTFDSFALKVDRENFQVLDLDPTVGIADEGQAVLMAGDAMAETFREFFEANDPAFLAFLDRYSRNSGEDALQENLLATYNQLRSFPDYMDWFHEQTELLRNAAEEGLPGPYAERILQETRYQLAQVISVYRECLQILDENYLSGLADKVKADIEDLMEAAREKDLAGTLAGIVVFKPRQLRAGDGEKEGYALVKDTIVALRKEGSNILSHLRDSYCAVDWTKEAARLAETAPYASMIESILLRFEEIFREMKREKGVIDFADIEHYAIKALKNEAVAGIYRDKFKYIFVDEYQDSNYLQEAILGAIARDDNLFMVGDVKQSIYGFRLAEPEIFRMKYHRYRKDPAAGMALDLNENFRSKAPVIETVNELFSEIMEGYDDEAALHQGNPSKQDIHYPVKLDVIHTDTEDLGDLDEEILDMKNQEYEAHRVCRIIREYLGKPYYDAKAEKVRNLQLGDMVILMSSVKAAGPVFKEILAEEGLDSYVEEGTGFFDAIEIATFMDLLRVIDNPRRDVPLMSALRSFLLHFTVEDLIAIRLHTMEGPFCDAFTAYAETGPDEDLVQKVRETLEKLDSWRRRSRYLPIDGFLWMLLQETGYEAYMGALPGGTQRIANLRALVDKAVKLKSSGDVKMYDFLRFVDALSKGKGVDISPAHMIGESENVLRIMTIHKSKGLEFPVVILCGAGKSLMTPNKGEGWMLHRDVGLGLKYVDLEHRLKADTLPVDLIYDQAKRKEREEDIRVLYVALTRAKDILHIVGTMKGKRPANSFLRWMLPIFEESEKDSLKVEHFLLTDLFNEQEQEDGSFGPEAAELPDDGLRDKVDRILSYRYPAAMSDVKSKYSVSELNHPEGSMPTLNVPAFIAKEEQSLTGAAAGTVYHAVLEHLDFAEGVGILEKDPAGLTGWIEGKIKDMVDREILQPYEAAIVKSRYIESFLREDMTARMSAAQIHKETPFTIYHEVEGQEVLVQGIIDCWFEEEDGLVLIDYKSNQSEESIRENYRVQMDLYREALAKLTGRKVKEAYLYLLRFGKFIPM